VVENPISKFFYPLFMISMVESTVTPKWHVLNRAKKMYDMERSGIEPLTSTMPLLRSTN
jgi:hypothetical protein